MLMILWKVVKIMRLINADKVKEYIIKEGFYCDTKADKEATAKEIDSLFPTVKAIPIECIEKEIRKIDEDIKWAWYYGNVAIDKMEYLKTWLTVKLEDWEKDNEESN